MSLRKDAPNKNALYVTKNDKLREELINDDDNEACKSTNDNTPKKKKAGGKKAKPKKVKEKEYWWCYILRSEGPDQEWLKYVGMTNEIDRRILQHNGKKKDGAKYTTSFNRGPWVFAMNIGGFPNFKSAF